MSSGIDRRNSTLGNPDVRRAQRTLPKLTEEQILEFKEAFKLFDKDNGGSIDVDELKDALESLGQVVTEESIQALVDEVDEDGSGEIEFDEFLVLMSRQILNSDVVYDCEKAFDIWDSDHDGRITVEQVRSVFQRLPERPTEDEISELIDIADSDRDGMINFDDLMNMLDSYKPH
jgi:Ca2+-binding EF-hand superfamily protein